MEVILMGVDTPITVSVKGKLLVYAIVFSQVRCTFKHLTLSILQKQLTAISARIYLLKANDGNKNNVWNVFDPLSTNPTKRSNTLPTNCLSVFDHFVELALKQLKLVMWNVALLVHLTLAVKISSSSLAAKISSSRVTYMIWASVR